jgi:hypothetical protein
MNYLPFLVHQLSQKECLVGTQSGPVILDVKLNCRCGWTIADLQSRLLTDVVEAAECMRWWIKGGFLDDGRISLEDENEEENSSEKVDDPLMMIS